LVPLRYLGALIAELPAIDRVVKQQRNASRD
jgi:hypothetical protein